MARSVRRGSGSAVGEAARGVSAGATGSTASASRLPAAPALLGGSVPMTGSPGAGVLGGMTSTRAPGAASGSTSPATPRSASSSPLTIARSTVGTLPVSGAGAMGGVANAAGEVARTVAQEAASEQVARLADASAVSSVSRDALGVTVGAGEVQRSPASPGSADAGTRGGHGPSEDEQRESLMKFATSDEFEQRVIEALEDRLLSQIERRGGRYGGWFA